MNLKAPFIAKALEGFQPSTSINILSEIIARDMIDYRFVAWLTKRLNNEDATQPNFKPRATAYSRNRSSIELCVPIVWCEFQQAWQCELLQWDAKKGWYNVGHTILTTHDYTNKLNAEQELFEKIGGGTVLSINNTEQGWIVKVVIDGEEIEQQLEKFSFFA